MFYKNFSNATFTFYGVTFKPGEIKEVEGYINHPKFVRITDKEKIAKADSKKENQKEIQTENQKEKFAKIDIAEKSKKPAEVKITEQEEK